MPVSALVITMTDDDAAVAEAIATMRADSRLTLGEPTGAQLPVVVETDDISQGVELVQDVLPGLAGVAFVHVVSVDFSDLESFDEKLPPRRRRAAGREV